MIFTIENNIINTFLGKNLVTNNRAFLFLYLKSQNENYNSIILCINHNLNIDAWQVLPNKSIKKIAEFLISDFALILPLLINSTIDNTKKILLSTFKDADEITKNIVKKVINNFNSIEKFENTKWLNINKEFFSQFTHLLFDAYNYNIFSIKRLINFIDKNTTTSDANKIKFLFQTLNSKLGENFNSEISIYFKFCILRELVCVVTGKHVVRDPFTLDYIFSDSAILCKIGNYYSRLIKYKSSYGHDFIERRGPGWLDITSSIILSNGLIIDTRLGPRHDAQRPNQPIITTEESELVKKLFENNPGLEEEKKQYLLINVDYGNLGHVLWNEVSGYVEFILCCMDAQLNFKKIKPLLPPSISSNFSKLGARSHFFPYIKKSLYNQALQESKSNIIIDYINSISEEPIIYKFFIKNQPISFRFPQMSKLVSDTIANDFPHIKKTKIHIYKNIRFHNKSQTNIIECLSKFLEKLIEQKDLGLKSEDIEIDLEFSSDTVKGPSFQARDYVNNIINKIKSLCAKYNVKLNIHDSYDIPELMKLISGSDICIVPIGSGAVLPTWIFNKYTVMHANQNHYTQLEWWNQVGNIKNDNQFIIDSNKSYDVLETTGSLYSNYTIDPDAYSDTIIKALKAYKNKNEN